MTLAPLDQPPDGRSSDFADLYERAPCGLLSTTPDGVILRANRTLLDWLGYRSDEVVGRKALTDLLTPGGRIYHETHYAPLLRMHGHARELALELVSADGTRLPALLNAVVDVDEHGDSRGVRIAVFDATERRQYERELLEAKRRAEESDRRARELAHTLQQSVVPPRTPDVPGLDLATCFVPGRIADDVGGDFYDVFPASTGDWVVLIGDVEGKGAGAAVLAALARHTVRAAAVDHQQPSEILRTLNEVLVAEDTDRFCTAAVLRLRRDGSRWHAVLSCGGHPLPIAAHAGRAAEPVGRPGTLLGYVDAVSLHDTEFALAAGDTMVLYTDGVTEARRGRELFGEDRLRRIIDLGAGSVRELVGSIHSEVEQFASDAPRDDVAIVGVRVRDVEDPPGERAQSTRT